ncbi:hypothetical protein [Nostoc favosum]|uniref:Uncharacterized protein n=1 Tax=Nostoc favosum CHAB5714 TaxID=2780399 RepID=A0ABS8IBT2_9NOSO|nr:hypothetical protein [Nostoc favosum]MCC5600967.1 hypothetical protein [Nostoc favosum CHAB5714]
MRFNVSDKNRDVDDEYRHIDNESRNIDDEYCDIAYQCPDVDDEYRYIDKPYCDIDDEYRNIAYQCLDVDKYVVLAIPAAHCVRARFLSDFRKSRCSRSEMYLNKLGNAIYPVKLESPL